MLWTPDTGAEVSCIGPTQAEQLGVDPRSLSAASERSYDANGQELQCNGQGWKEGKRGGNRTGTSAATLGLEAADKGEAYSSEGRDESRVEEIGALGVWLPSGTDIERSTALCCWLTWLELRLARYRLPHCSTGRAPSELLHGRIMRLQLPVFAQQPPPDPAVRLRVEKQQWRNKRKYDARHATRR
ncbi:hypothetical protein FJT64_007243 [Amphibalanus amphitrite]|uniref:Uncharacterized protein n=1 Tax=Amphibalanus amphitrite TaxID=1232801 RepID=A0A6A4W008_AMPAM|nr:hypothetical protein FJT64_007243 [Amphibalanus amphitrite]